MKFGDTKYHTGTRLLYGRAILKYLEYSNILFGIRRRRRRRPMTSKMTSAIKLTMVTVTAEANLKR
jgi:hypothetical protein